MESCSSDKISCSAAPTALEGKRAPWKCQLCVAAWICQPAQENPSSSKVETLISFLGCIGQEAWQFCTDPGIKNVGVDSFDQKGGGSSRSVWLLEEVPGRCWLGHPHQAAAAVSLSLQLEPSPCGGLGACLCSEPSLCSPPQQPTRSSGNVPVTRCSCASSPSSTTACATAAAWGTS